MNKLLYPVNNKVPHQVPSAEPTNQNLMDNLSARLHSESRNPADLNTIDSTPVDLKTLMGAFAAYKKK
jgi:hypothetical protein